MASRNDAQAEGVSLFRQSDFLRFWLGESVSWLGSQVTVLALPLAAISTLRAPVRAVGFLAAAGTAAMTVVMPFAGPWLDARPVRPVIIATNVLRAAVLMSVPLAFSFSAVSMPLLYMVALAVGAFSGVFDIAVVTYVPRLVHAARLVDANSMVGASGAVAETAGPAVGGALIRLFTAPVAILADVFSYLVSTVLLVSVRKPEYVPRTSPAAGTVARRVSWGIRYCLSHPRLRLLLIASAWFNLWEQAIMAVFLVYALRVLSVSATVLGIFLAAAGCGAAAGSAAAAPAGRRLGLGKILAYGAGVAAASLALSPVPGKAAASFVIGPLFFVYGFGLGLFNVHSVAYRQTVTPADSQAQVNAGYRLFVYGTAPVGAVTAGFLGQLIGTRAAIAAAAAALTAGTAVFSVYAWRHLAVEGYGADQIGHG